MVFSSFSDIFNTGNVIESKSETGTERQWDRKTNKERKVKMELVSDQEIHPPKKKEFNKKTHAHEISKVIWWHYVCPFFLSNGCVGGGLVWKTDKTIYGASLSNAKDSLQIETKTKDAILNKSSEKKTKEKLKDLRGMGVLEVEETLDATDL